MIKFSIDTHIDVFGVWWDKAPYHHHISSERVGQVSYGGVAVSIRGLALRAVSWLVAPVSKKRG